jgi:serine/threonine protein kinase
MVELTAEKEKAYGGYVVTKRVPTDEWVINRLKRRWPELPYELVEKRAKKFTEKIFPLFLTREAAILKILQEHLPPNYRNRVPVPVYVEKDSRGFVRVLQMNWLRNGGKPLSQFQFALQAADLLRAVHDAAEVIHLDLRLDNMVVTPAGVGFVDFGSAVRVGEDISSNPLLATLYGELMKTSHIQRMLDQMTISGHVTAEHFCNSRGKVDKSVDVFYLAVQFNSPHDNPDLKELIEFKPGSDEAVSLGKLTKEILAPADPVSPTIRTARDVVLALQRVGEGLK